MQKKENTNKKKIYSAVSLFSGAGGLDLGFHKSGRVKTKACYENESIFSETLRFNLHRLKVGNSYPLIHQQDLNSSEVIAEIKKRYSGTDIVFGGPPCQSFSIMGKTVAGKKTGTKDPRGRLVYSFVSIVKCIKPKAFLFENVPNIANIEKGILIQDLTSAFKEMGFSLWSDIVCAADFGARTFRKRFFIIGVRGSMQIPQPKSTHVCGNQLELFESGKKRWNTSESIFKTIKEYECSGQTLFNHDKVKHNKETIRRFNKLRYGETDNIRKRNRIDPTRPAHSVYVGGLIGKLQARTHIHPYEPRELTARECALVQGFPIDWFFAGRADAALQQAANAVPVELARAMAIHIVNLLDKNCR